MIFRNLAYLFQSEDYDVLRFLKGAYSQNPLAKREKRKNIVWTMKIRALGFLVVLLFLLGNGLVVFLMKSVVFFLLFNLFFLLFLPLFFVLALFLILPLDAFLKEQKLERARKIMRKNQLTVIGITGSFGKTSLKEILTTILREKFTVLVPSENINTALGVAEFILSNEKAIKNSQIFIVEMGAYKKGDIEKICHLVAPDFSLLTGINQAHLERFGSQEKIIQTKFELAENTKKISFLNFNNALVKENYQKFKIKKVLGVTMENIQELEFEENFQGMRFAFKKTVYRTRLIAQHNLELLALCLELVEILGLDEKQRKAGVEKIQFIKHRMEPIYNSQRDIFVIDDSYNGNYNGFVSGLEVLGRAKGKKVVITPGISELGPVSREVHRKIGALYAEKIDFLILIKSPGSVFMEEMLKEKGFRNYIVFDDAQKAHQALKELLKSGDTILFQNDLSDNFF